MGAISNLTNYKTYLNSSLFSIPFVKSTLTTVAGRQYETWTTNNLAGSAPTTAVAPTKATTGALNAANYPNAGTEQLYCVGGHLSSTNPGVFILCDRLSHQGGLSGTTTGAQTTNLPTAALTRYTDGVGVICGLSIYSQVGTTGTTVTVSYTNEANTSGRTSPTVVFGGTGFREANRFIQIPLQAGDTGVRAVASVTLAASTTTAGNFGVTLYKPLIAFTINEPGRGADFNLIDGGMSGGLPEIIDDACLFWMYMTYGTSTALFGNLRFVAV